jgi:Protein of unknown function (DUF1703)./Predicted AAA-ATPase.
MGTYINIGNNGFESARNGEYIDKSGLIAIINNTINSKRRFSCVSRSRRFGKSMAAEMLCAYYDHSCDSRKLFSDLEISKDSTFETHLNKYPVIYLDMTAFVTRFKDENIVVHIQEELKKDISKAYPDVTVDDTTDLMQTLIAISENKKEQFIMIIDEWDAICREFKPGTSAMDDYLNWLRRMFKEVNANRVFAAVYMTGILPIKKYKTESALNNFWEYSMVEPRNLDRYFGFTKQEVKDLSQQMGMEFDELEKWYDGYQIGDELSMFNPNSVIQAVYNHRCRSYWASTGAFDTVTHYIQMNYDGLKDDIINMLGGGRCKVNPTKFQNDMSIISSKDDVLTVLIHLGYLSYNWRKDECYIPNLEVAGEMANAVESTGWKPVVDALSKSEKLLQDTLNGNTEAVSYGIEAVHDMNTSILSYNDENSLACVLSIAYYYARNNYIFYREYPSGKGYADLVLIPRKHVDSPAIIVELKYDKTAQGAINQIKRKNYPAQVKEYTNNILLVGVNYDKLTKLHTCIIERCE